MNRQHLTYTERNKNRQQSLITSLEIISEDSFKDLDIFSVEELSVIMSLYCNGLALDKNYPSIVKNMIKERLESDIVSSVKVNLLDLLITFDESKEQPYEFYLYRSHDNNHVECISVPNVNSFERYCNSYDQEKRILLNAYDAKDITVINIQKDKRILGVLRRPNNQEDAMLYITGYKLLNEFQNSKTIDDVTEQQDISFNQESQEVSIEQEKLDIANNLANDLTEYPRIENTPIEIHLSRESETEDKVEDKVLEEQEHNLQTQIDNSIKKTVEYGSKYMDNNLSVKDYCNNVNNMTKDEILMYFKNLYQFFTTSNTIEDKFSLDNLRKVRDINVILMSLDYIPSN